MDIEVVMPAIGAGTTEGRILQWLKQSGDTVKVGDILAEIETDKAIIELEALDSGVLGRIHVEAGDTAVPVGDVIATLSGPARAMLTAERTALNFLGHLSGVASATARIADAIGHTKARVTCTRKTMPGLRAVQKYAVRVGGGSNHRFGLDDAVLIKDNHVAIAGGLRNAVTRARAAVGHMVQIEVEVDTLAQLQEALALQVPIVLLDNMDLPMLREAVAMTAGRAVLEASGRVTQETAPGIAETGVDQIAIGWITHSAAVLDIGLDTLE